MTMPCIDSKYTPEKKKNKTNCYDISYYFIIYYKSTGAPLPISNNRCVFLVAGPKSD